MPCPKRTLGPKACALGPQQPGSRRAPLAQPLGSLGSRARRSARGQSGAERGGCCCGRAGTLGASRDARGGGETGWEHA
eukprot:5764599-Pyramimonas_sp.AAC.1